METVRIFGLDFVDSDVEKVATDFLAQVEHGKGLKTVVTPNPEQMVLAWQNAHFMALLSQADVRLPDGEGIVWASQHYAKHGLLSKAISNRITGADLVQRLIYQNGEKGRKIALIGGFGYQNVTSSQWPGVQKLNLAKTQKMNQSEIYWCQGYQNIAQVNEEEEKAVRQFIREYRPKIVLVALGAPWQEKWLLEHREFLAESGVRLGMVVGGAFDFLTGKVARAPKKWQKWHLEWLWRLIKEPWRWKRQLALPKFVWRVIFDQKVQK